MSLLSISRELRREAGTLRFGKPVSHVYNPLDYAWQPYRAYLERYGRGPGRVVLLGMNPGPFGMAQTGVPFGDVVAVRDWLGIEAPVGKPPSEHPKRPVTGFACPRGEVSGQRLWGWARALYRTPARFFREFFVLNYCPLCFMEPSGRNLTPDKLARREREALFAVCDAALRRSLALLAPTLVVGVGHFATGRLRHALAGLGSRIGRAPHPSPASPQANLGWEAQMNEALLALGVRLPAQRRAATHRVRRDPPG